MNILIGCVYRQRGGRLCEAVYKLPTGIIKIRMLDNDWATYYVWPNGRYTMAGVSSIDLIDLVSEMGKVIAFDTTRRREPYDFNRYWTAYKKRDEKRREFEQQQHIQTNIRLLRKGGKT